MEHPINLISVRYHDNDRKWAAGEEVTEPIIEAVITGTGGGTAMAFRSQGRAIRELNP